MSKSFESPTRVADSAAALTANANFAPAIKWLRHNTAMSRLTDLEIEEAIRDAATAGVMSFKWGANTIP